MQLFDVIAFDADDTLWHTERLYVNAQTRFKELLSHYHPPEWIEQRLYEAEMRNLQHFGYGIKAFALSMIETAIELTDGQITGRDLQAILDQAKAMLAAEVELLEHVQATVTQLAQVHNLMLITKGDLLDQEQKIARSGLAPCFRQIEIVSNKTPAIYQAILAKHGLAPKRFLMVGNSLRSDILPVLEIGASAVYIPHPLTWAHDMADPPPNGQPGFYELAHIGLLPELIEQISIDLPQDSK
jgi:putative hydrolase of the HAD superfamily